MSDQDLPKSLDEIRAKFPYQFEGESIGMSVPKGWASGFARLCADIDAALGENKHGFHWIQLKEKFGSARFYYAFGRRRASVHLDIVAGDGVRTFVAPQAQKPGEDEFNRVSQAVDKLVSDATAKTRHACLVCGAHGDGHLSEGYLMVLCPAHQATRESKDGWPEDLWDMLEEDRIKVKDMYAKVEAMRRQPEESKKNGVDGGDQ